MKALTDEKERALRVLEDQRKRKDDAAEVERRVVERCREFSDSLDGLDGKGKRAVLSAFGVQVQASKDDLRITLSISPECTTIGQTSACSSSSVYSFVIADLKEVISWDGRQKVVEFVPC